MAGGQRLGGDSRGGGQPLKGEERLEKLLASRAYGGAAVPDAQAAASAGAPSRPPVPAAPGRGRASSAAPAKGARLASAGSGCGVRRPTPGRPNIHTLSGSASGGGGSSGSGSRLHNTTEAYRQQRGTTARTVEAVGRATMTREKAAEVDRARERVRGPSVPRPPVASAGGGTGGGSCRRPRAPSAPGYRLGSA
eukprot:TRINITY_DN73342_c0_g1_i1.p2 TRINITY_DN73342_c0_g1~~TRINITY_DN73342_c0_g1_i1.p2  ORF type:complete len:214 (+),score=41.75 TRINITY_DN73342_c0_g1_i1:62-643(+)